jgi:hypothetical protein
MANMPPLTSTQGLGIDEEEFDLAGMSEEELQQLISLGVIDEQMAENARQMALQEGLRYQSAPEGRQAGRVYVAANPLEHIGKGLEQYNAQKRMKELEAQRGGLQEQQTSGRGTYWDLLRGKRKSKVNIDIPTLPKYEL